MKYIHIMTFLFGTASGSTSLHENEIDPHNTTLCKMCGIGKITTSRVFFTKKKNSRILMGPCPNHILCARFFEWCHSLKPMKLHSGVLTSV